MFDEKWFHCIHAGSVFNPFVAGVRLRNLLLARGSCVVWCFCQLNPFFLSKCCQKPLHTYIFPVYRYFSQKWWYLVYHMIFLTLVNSEKTVSEIILVFACLWPNRKSPWSCKVSYYKNLVFTKSHMWGLKVDYMQIRWLYCMRDLRKMSLQAMSYHMNLNWKGVRMVYSTPLLSSCTNYNTEYTAYISIFCEVTALRVKRGHRFWSESHVTNKVFLYAIMQHVTTSLSLFYANRITYWDLSGILSQWGCTSKSLWHNLSCPKFAQCSLSTGTWSAA